jgi:DNA segregation ATPase FtsK/SpoIIIE-like protein
LPDSSVDPKQRKSERLEDKVLDTHLDKTVVTEELHTERERTTLKSKPLKEQTKQDDQLSDWIVQKARQLDHALRNYEIGAHPTDPDKADVGPVIVRFKVKLYPGEKFSRLEKLAPDLQRELGLRNPPFVKNLPYFVGIDIPRSIPEVVPLLSLLEYLPDVSIGNLPFLIGKTPSGEVVQADLAKLPHLLIAGSTGSGKTMFLYNLIVNLVSQFSEDELSLLLVDPKQTDFFFFKDLPHLIGGEVVFEPREAISRLEYLMADVLRERTQQLRRGLARDIRDYNKKTADEPIIPIVVIVDEYADLVQVLSTSERNDFERQLVRLAQRARSIGVHLVVATQRPTGDLVTTNLKTNLPARIAFRLPSYHDSMTILDQTGAENLLGQGDMLYRSSSSDIRRLQAPYITTEMLIQYLEEEV